MSTGRRAKTAVIRAAVPWYYRFSQPHGSSALRGDPGNPELRALPRRGPTVLHDLSHAAAMMMGKPLGTEDGTISSIFDWGRGPPVCDEMT